MSLDQAIRRLLTALDQIEIAVTRRVEAEAALEPLETELALMRDDRSRLAVDLDSALARGAALESAAVEVARRIDVAMDKVRAALAATPSEDKADG